MNKFTKVVLLAFIVAVFLGTVRENAHASTLNTGVTVNKITLPEYVFAGKDANIILHFNGGPITPDQDISIHPLNGFTYGEIHTGTHIPIIGWVDDQVIRGFNQPVYWDFNGNGCSHNCYPQTLPLDKSTSKWSGQVDIPVTIHIPSGLPSAIYPIRIGLHNSDAYKTLVAGPGVYEKIDSNIYNYEVGSLTVATPCRDVNYTFTRNLRENDSDPDVTLLQSYLYVDEPSITKLSPPSGLFDNNTVSALGAYQKNAKLPVTGIFDDATRAYINSECNLDRSIPTINNITPSSAISGARITLNGANFKPDSKLHFILETNEAALVEVKPISVTPTQIIANVPDISPGCVYNTSTCKTFGWYIEIVDKHYNGSYDTSNPPYVIPIRNTLFKVTPTPDTTAPSIPEKPIASSVTIDGLTLSWAGSTELVSGSGIAGYKIYKDGNLLASIDAPIPLDSNPNPIPVYAVTGLSPNTRYSFTIASFDKAGNISAQSAPATVTTNLLTIDRICTMCAYVEGSQFSYSRSFNLPFDANGLAEIISTNPASINGSVAYSTSDNMSFIMTGSFTGSFTIDSGTKAFLGGKEAVMTGHSGLWLYVSPTLDLKFGSTYEFYLADANGKVKTNKVKIKISGPFTDSPQSHISGTSRSSGNVGDPVTVNGTGFTGALKNGIALTDSSGISVNVIPTSASDKSLQFTIPTLVARDYNITVLANGGVSNPWAIKVKAAQLDTVPPSTPGQPVSSNPNSTALTLSWSASIDNIGVVQYNIYKNGELLTTSPIPLYTVMDLTPNVAYSFVITAVDAAGNISEKSLSSSLKTTSTSENILTPVIYSVSPTSGPFESKITIIGTNFLTESNRTSVTVFFTNALGKQIRLTPDSISSTKITFYLPSDFKSYISGNTVFGIQVVNFSNKVPGKGDTSSNILNFTITAPKPAITSISANSGKVGDSITVYGTGFDNLSTDAILLTNSVGVSTKATVLSTTAYSIEFKVPNIVLDPKGYNVTVHAEAGISNTWTMYVKSDTVIPIVITPPAVVVSKPAISAIWYFTGTTAKYNDTLTVIGTNLTPILADGLFLTNSNGATVGVSAIAPTATRVQFKMPNLPTGAYNVNIKTSAGLSNSWTFSVTGAAVVPTADTLAPSVPNKPSASNVTTTGFTLYWPASTDNVGVLGYKVYRNGSLIGSIINSVAYVVSGLTANTTYNFTVSAFDNVGNESSQSLVLPVTTAGSGTVVSTTPTIPSTPFMTSITPSIFKVGVPINITIAGTNFNGVIEELISISNASGTLSPTLISATPTEIKISIPPLPIGTYYINFSADKGDSNTQSFTVTSAVGMGSTNRASVFDWFISLFK